MSNAAIFDSINKKLKNLDDEFTKEFSKEFVQRVKRRTPVITGRLQAGWETKITPNEILIKNEVEYAGYVEDGTEHMSGAHMLKITKSEIPEISRLAQRKIVKRGK